MCQYSCEDGFATDWHLVHLGSRAVGGASLVMAEATGVEARGRISPGDLGLWKDAQMEPLARIAKFVREHGAAPGIQLAHAGRKASAHVPWEHRGAHIPVENGGWVPVAPSAIAFREDDRTPHELTHQEIGEIVAAFAAAAERAVRAGFELIEIHGAHGYLIHEFCSPLANHRTDQYGGSLENRVRFAAEVVKAVRAVIPDSMPLFLRVSASDWVEGAQAPPTAAPDNSGTAPSAAFGGDHLRVPSKGWTLEESVVLARCARTLGVDLIDCSSGGMVPYAKIELGPGYQVPFAERIRRQAGIATAAVGMITEPNQAEEIVAGGKADLVMLARELLRDPYWPLHAAKALGVKPAPPVQYGRAF
jgi:2,4-dienoyl-CoA reductase-like NADH-dependent reductase (Old Yellow Enzyme family)